MATIPVSFDTMRRNYPEQLQELSTLVQNSRGQDRNMAPEDMNWSIEYSTVVQALSITDLLNGLGMNQLPVPQTPPQHHFEFKVVAGRIIKTLPINFTPAEFTQQQNNIQRNQEEMQNLLNSSLQMANADPQGTWLRVQSQDERGRPCVHAFPIRAAFKTAKNKILVVTETYDVSHPHGCYYLENQTAVILEKNDPARLITVFQTTTDGHEVRVQNRRLEKMSQAEIKALTDFTVYREDIAALLGGLDGLGAFALPNMMPRPRRR